MSITKEMNRLMTTKNCDWAYCVISHIAEHGGKYEEAINSYNIITGLLNNPQRGSVQPQNMEVLTSGYAPLPNGGQALFAICYRDIPVHGLLPQIQAQINQSNRPTANMLLVFVPTQNLLTAGDTAISVYKIENRTVSKV